MKCLPEIPTRLDWRYKGFWIPQGSILDREFVEAGHSLFDGSFTWPVMALRSDALENNVRVMSSFAERHGLAFAPHAKTSMSPQLIDMQIDAGAWGVSVATANQALAAFDLGVKNVLIANQVLDSNAIGGLVSRGACGDCSWMVYVDSMEGVQAAAAGAHIGGSPVSVLIELGHANGRTGCRTPKEVLELAKLVADTPNLELAGLSGYEGGLPDAEAVDAYLHTLRQTYADIAALDIIDGRGVLSAGGSKWFDYVGEVLGGEWLNAKPLVLLRSGAYITHDDGVYQKWTPFVRIPDEGCLKPAIEVWAQIISVPEQGLALIGMGKRDIPYDEGLPVPKLIRRSGDDRIEEFTDGRITRTNDQHAYLEFSEATKLRPGDLVCFGVSHPCTSFDKWLALPVIDSERNVVEVARTYL